MALEGISGYDGMPYLVGGKVREDFKIDTDIRIILFDTYLINNRFKYISTLPGQYGGTRQYEHPNKVYVGLSWHPSKPLDIWWSIDRLPDHKPLFDGIGLPSLILKLSKYL